MPYAQCAIRPNKLVPPLPFVAEFSDV